MSLLIALLLVPLGRAQTSTAAAVQSDNTDLTHLFDEDQRVRQPKPLGPDEPKITRTDADRLALVKQMLANEQLHTSADYFHAALVLQHSRSSADYLIAHTLAVLCATDHNATCLWLSAATLDRYLQSINQPQIYGTQYLHFNQPSVTQQPYAANVISDSIRSKLGVPTLKEQAEQLTTYQQQVAAPRVKP
ncbi:MAG: hypothetical protein M3Y50_03425 [Acidobacteriota bacterium]|nr:hypothetical protein [Acidobacteriota bacterium]